MSVSHWNVVESYEKHKEQPTAYVRRIPNNQDVDYKIVPFQDARICMLWFGDEWEKKAWDRKVLVGKKPKFNIKKSIKNMSKKERY